MSLSGDRSLCLSRHVESNHRQNRIVFRPSLGRSSPRRAPPSGTRRPGEEVQEAIESSEVGEAACRPLSLARRQDDDSRLRHRRSPLPRLRALVNRRFRRAIHRKPYSGVGGRTPVTANQARRRAFRSAIPSTLARERSAASHEISRTNHSTSPAEKSGRCEQLKPRTDETGETLTCVHMIHTRTTVPDRHR